MNREIKLAIREIRRAEREQRILAILAGIEARRAEHEQKLDAIHACLSSGWTGKIRMLG